MSEPDSAPPRSPQTTRRVNSGRGHRYEIDGQRVDGVTWAVDAIRKKALEGWFAKVTREYCINHWDELVAMPQPTDRLNALAKAPYAERDAAANRGTEVHRLAERLAAGESVTVPEVLAGHIEAYQQFAEEWQLDEILVETPVFHRRLRYAGTLDVVARLSGGEIFLLDFKTSRSGIYPEVALQLASYRNAEFYLDADGNEQPLPPIDRCGAVWLRADGYDFYPVTAGDREFRLWQYARQLAHYLEDPPEQYIGESLRPAEQAA